MNGANNTTGATYVAYMRVSTKDQNLGLPAQAARIHDYIERNGATLVAEYSEKESGKNDNRPELSKAIAHCKKTGATLIVAKLDRLTRHAIKAWEIRESGIRLLALDCPFITDSLTFSIFVGMLQHERELISQRTRAALQVKKAQGCKLGNGRKMSDDVKAKGKETRRHNTTERNKKATELIKGWLKGTEKPCLTDYARRLNDLDVKTAKGGEWRANQVARIIERIRNGVA